MRNQEELIETFFKDEEIKYEKMLDGRYTCNFSGKNAAYCVYVSCSNTMEYLMVYTLCSINIPAEKREAAMEFITRANFGMRVGCFEMNCDNGEIRFRTSISSKDSEIPQKVLHRKFYTSIGTLDGYYTGLMKVVFGNADPHEVINEIEGN